MNTKLLYTIFFAFFFISFGFSQNTVGTLVNTSDSYNGYTLFTKFTETYLINNCGEVVNQWTSGYNPGNAVYLLEDGSLLRACNIGNQDITFGGVGGRIEKHDWNGNLIWEYNYSSSSYLQHHDIYPMPNGNVLILAVAVLSNSEAIQAGRNSSNLTDGNLYNEQVIELEPVGTNSANIVWEWNVKNHLIQDFDNTKDNFGSVEINPQLLDINYLGNSAGKNNWLHFNSMQYIVDLDQIVLSSRLLSEIYIIDHSTTTAEAATSSGGVYNKGGNFLYRWGNPEAYRQGTSNERQLFGQHYAHFIPEGLPDEGKLILFNNGFGRSPSFSEVLIFEPPTSSPGNYTYTSNTAYGPTIPEYIYKDPAEETDFFSRFLSSAQKLPNGNTLICSGANGYTFEIDANHNKVWEYILPIGTSGIMTQGDNPFESGNTIFRAIRYGTDYSAFLNNDVTPGNPIELNPDLSNCQILNVDELQLELTSIYPNPVIDKLFINSKTTISSIEVYNILGEKIINNANSNNIDLSYLSSGIYLSKIKNTNGEIITKRIIKN